ncbi:MAG: type I methionyl aminopeptidase [Bacteroidales bacterium]|nr:type I methionyl aminopeptidase [Bacteroidales bacterium]
MIRIYSAEEIELIRESSLLVGKTLAEVAKHIGVGVKTITLDNVAEEYIHSVGATPGFKGYEGFPYALCISINEVVVHGFPSDYELKEGDIVSIDCGVYKNGFHGDSAYTFAIGEVGEEKRKLMQTTKEALYKGIEQAREGNRVGDISYAVQSYCEAQGYGVVRELVGHGVGAHLHEKPDVPNFGRQGSGKRLRAGMVIAIEPMITMGTHRVRWAKDGWGVFTQDSLPAAHYEHDVVIGKNGADILSSFDEIEKVLAAKAV